MRRAHLILPRADDRFMRAIGGQSVPAHAGGFANAVTADGADADANARSDDWLTAPRKRSLRTPQGRRRAPNVSDRQGVLTLALAAVEIRNLGGRGARERRPQTSGFPLSRE